MDRLRGSFPTGTYVNVNTLASSSTTAVNFVPRLSTIAYTAGLSNNADPANSYTLYSGAGTGNRGYATTCRLFSQTATTGTSSVTEVNGMYFRIADGRMFPFAAGFEEPTAWVYAIGLNHFNWFSGDIFFNDVHAFFFYGNNEAFYNAFWNPSLAQIYDGNNFFAVFVSGGVQQWGMLNRAQLRAGVIQPVFQVAMFGPGSTIWDNSLQNMSFRHGINTQSGSRSLRFQLGWDEILIRGYSLPPEAPMAGTSSTTTRAKVFNPGPATYIQGRIFQ
jgi:hypothetical protein